MKIDHPLRKLVMTLAVAALAAPAAASAQAHFSIQIGLPAVLPPLVVVEPGVQVVEDYGEEIFFVDGYYWVHRGDRWYRTRDHRARWTFVEPRWVPGALVRIPHGHYRHWRSEYQRPAWRHEHWRPHQGHEHRQHAYRHHGNQGGDRDHARRHGREEQGRRHGGWEHGKAQRREWREARWQPAGHHERGPRHR
jgi:hypothetical protein